MISNIQYPDWIVFFLVLLITFTVVVLGNKILGRKEVDEKDSVIELLLMGRTLTLPLFVATLVATWYGGIFGVAKIAFESGIYNFITQGFFWYVSYLIFAFVIFKRIKNYKAITLPDLLHKAVGPKAKVFAAWFNILNLLPIAYCISIGKLLEIFFGIDLVTGSILGVSFVLIYSMFGGFRSVVLSDLVQFFVMVSSVIMVLAFSVYEYGLAPLKSLPDHYFSFTGNHSLMETLLWGCLAMATLIDPNFYQRAFAAQSDKVVTRGIVISTIIWMCFDLSLTFGAMYARSLMPDLPSDQGYFIYATEILPTGLKGFFLAGIMATILSTLDSYLFLAGTTISFDLLPKSLSEKKITHYASIIFVGILALLISLFFEGNVKNVWKSTGSLLTAGMLVPTLACYRFREFQNDRSFLMASISGITTTLIWLVFGFESLYEIPGLYIGVLGSINGLLISKLFFTNYSSLNK